MRDEVELLSDFRHFLGVRELGLRGGPSIPAVITATVNPVVQSVTEGDTWADLLLPSATTASNYDSTASVNDPTPVAEVRIDGGAWTALSGNEATVLNAGEMADVRVTVTDDAGSPPRVFNAGSTTVAYIAPTAGLALVDQSFAENTGVQTYDTSGDFTGTDLVYSVNSVTGVTINSSTGVVSFDTDAMAEQAGTTITVTATNSGGFVVSAFSLTILTASAELVNASGTGTATFTGTPPVTNAAGTGTATWSDAA